SASTTRRIPRPGGTRWSSSPARSCRASRTWCPNSPHEDPVRRRRPDASARGRPRRSAGGHRGRSAACPAHPARGVGGRLASVGLVPHQRRQEARYGSPGVTTRPAPGAASLTSLGQRFGLVQVTPDMLRDASKLLGTGDADPVAYVLDVDDNGGPRALGRYRSASTIPALKTVDE